LGALSLLHSGQKHKTPFKIISVAVTTFIISLFNHSPKKGVGEGACPPPPAYILFCQLAATEKTCEHVVLALMKHHQVPQFGGWHSYFVMGRGTQKSQPIYSDLGVALSFSEPSSQYQHN
jgi:hypothetical protein